MMSSSSSMPRRSAMVVRPQPVTESSLIETVGSFINEVRTIRGDLTSDPKVQVTWATFESGDLNDGIYFPEDGDSEGGEPPLFLILGYTTGIQVWIVASSGEAQEVLSWKHEQIKTLRVLPTPDKSFGENDNFARLRPLVVFSDVSGPGIPFSSCSFLSLKSGEQVHNIKFNSEISDIAVNRKVVVILFKEKMAVFNARTLESSFTITSCFPSPGVDCNPIALGDRWLAYADQKLMSVHRSFGGMEIDGGQSVTAWSINVGSKLAKGVSKIYSNIFAPGTRTNPSTVVTTPNLQNSSNLLNEPQKGIVTIIDILRVSRSDNEEINIADNFEGVVAHFVAHNKAIVAMKFDPSSSLLLTCDRQGNYFNLFRIVPHPAGSCYSAIHHLYSLYRGDTPGSVQDIAFSSDSRWVAVSTLRGTTHVFPITPYGGPIGVRTHTSHRVVNRLSRFHRSAGIDSPTTRTSSSGGRSSPNPILGASPIAGTFIEPNMSPTVNPYPNPHLAPFPTPTLVQPIAQLRQPYLLSSFQQLGSVSKKGGRSSVSEDVPIRLACTFAPSRAWLVGTQHNMFTRQQRNKNMDALFVMANHGVLLEYSLDPVPDSTLTKEKICESSPIELQIEPYGQWTLNKPRDRSELHPPLAIDNPLMLPLERTRLNRERQDYDDEDQWLSQVEIVTHIGPHRRLWMGPQFSFKTLQLVSEDSQEVQVFDVAVRPQASNPVNMQGRRTIPVLIEAGSAGSSFELSPRFHNFQIKRCESQVDLESELHEAMLETADPNFNLIDSSKRDSKEEEFFCLTPDDLSKASRSRNVSASDGNRSGPMSSATTVCNQVNDTKIFSVAVESRKSESKCPEAFRAVEVDSKEFNSRFAVVSSKIDLKNKVDLEPSVRSAEFREVTPRLDNEQTCETLNFSEEFLSVLSEAMSSEVKGPSETAKESVVNVETLSFNTKEQEEGPDEQEEEEEENLFYIPEKSASVEREEDSLVSRPTSEVSVWAGNFFNAKDSNSIIKDIESAEEKYNSGENEFYYISSVLKPTIVTNNQSSSRPTDSSEDEVSIPNVSRRQKKKKNKLIIEDSDSTEEENVEIKSEPEGWSFEADDLDVNRLISEVVNEEEPSPEKTSLDEVFKFDSEIQREEKRSFMGYESTEDGGCTISGGSSNVFTGGSTSESSVANSPNMKNTKGRSRMKKSRRKK